MFRGSCFFLSFLLFFLNQIKNSLFVLWVNLCMITGIYLHGPPPFNGPFFMTPPFSASKSCGPPSVSTFPTPLLISALTKTSITALHPPKTHGCTLHVCHFLIYCKESAHTKTRRLVFKKMFANLKMSKFSVILTVQLSIQHRKTQVNPA